MYEYSNLLYVDFKFIMAKFTMFSSSEELDVEKVCKGFKGVSNLRERVEPRCATCVGGKCFVCLEQQLRGEFEWVFVVALQVESVRPVCLLDAAHHNVLQFSAHVIAVSRCRVRALHAFGLLEIAVYELKSRIQVVPKYQLQEVRPESRRFVREVIEYREVLCCWLLARNMKHICYKCF